MQIDLTQVTTVDALTRCRQTVMTRANELLTDENPVPLTERAEALPAITGLLMTSLEELKVAEEELREQNDKLSQRRAADEALVVHYRALFAHVPMPAMVTDLYGTIIEVNLAASDLLSRDAKHLARKPLAALVDQNDRDSFRKQLGRVTDVVEPTNWSLTLQRKGDLPVRVKAMVKVVPSLGPTGSGVLFWLLQPSVLDN
jgi:PAS domain S-box-containing protein